MDRSVPLQHSCATARSETSISQTLVCFRFRLDFLLLLRIVMVQLRSGQRHYVHPGLIRAATISLVHELAQSCTCTSNQYSSLRRVATVSIAS